MKDQIWTLSRLNLQGNVVGKHPYEKIPSLSGVNALWSKEEILVYQASFFLVFLFPVTEYIELKNFQNLLSTLKQSNLPITCDEGVYREIQLIKPKEFQNIVLCMGTFHMTKVALGCIGKYLKGSGAEIILI